MRRHRGFASVAPSLVFAVVLSVAGAVPATAQPGMPGAGGMVGVPPTSGQTGMPDARTMSGIPMAVEDLPDGTVSVRVVRGGLSNPATDQTVELSLGGASRSAQTDANGRAQFSGLTADLMATAVAVVDGARLESERFSIPSKGGVRVLLVAPGGAAGAPAAGAVSAGAQAAQPVTGTVAFGGDSRIVVEFVDDVPTVYYLLEVVNPGQVPVNPVSPIVMDLPPGAGEAALLQDSSPQAVMSGSRVTIAGPFSPGRTSVRIGCRWPTGGGTLRIEQRLPIAVEQFVLTVQKVNGMQVSSPQVTNLRDMTDQGHAFVVASGNPIPAGGILSIAVTGLPYRSRLGAILAIAVALLVLGAGAVAVMRAPRQAGAAARRRQLEAQREGLLDDVVRNEERLRTGLIDRPQYTARRRGLVAELERVYGDLEAAGGAPDGSGKGFAA